MNDPTPNPVWDAPTPGMAAAEWWVMTLEAIPANQMLSRDPASKLEHEGQLMQFKQSLAASLNSMLERHIWPIILSVRSLDGHVGVPCEMLYFYAKNSRVKFNVWPHETTLIWILPDRVSTMIGNDDEKTVWLRNKQADL